MSAETAFPCHHTVERRGAVACIEPCGQRARWRVSTDVPFGWLRVCGRHADWWRRRGLPVEPLQTNNNNTARPGCNPGRAIGPTPEPGRRNP